MRGQALVLFMVLAGVLCLGALLIFNTGQTVNKKVRLTHAADAAAYSVAVQEAKVLNFAAYLNRAQVANEVTIAQMVSMWSWMNMVHTHTLEGYNLFTYLAGIAAGSVVLSPAAPLLQAIATAYKVAEKAVAVMRTGYHTMVTAGGVIPGMEGGFISALSKLNGVYATASGALLKAVGSIDGYTIATQVAERNDPTAKFSADAHLVLLNQLRKASALSGVGEYFNDFSKDKNGAEGMDRFRNVVMASRDEFTADRGQNLDLWIAEIGTWGGTDMVDYDRWAGLDTMMIEINLPWPLDDIDMPLGWGGAQAVADASSTPGFFPGIQSAQNGGDGWYSAEHGRDYEPYGDVRGISGELADQYPSVDAPFLWGATNDLTNREDAYFGDYEGLHPYQDIKEEYAQSPEGKKAGPSFTVYLYSERPDARTSEDIDGIGGTAGSALDLENGMANDRVTAIATAQTYFNRPPDYSLFQRMVPREWNGAPQTDDQLERGSLFSPYWQAKLIETPLETYALVGAASVAGIP